MKMQLSFFGLAKDIEAIAAAGYDYIEMHYHEVIGMSEDEFAALQKKLADSPLRVDVLNNPLPLTQQIIAPDYQLADYREHLKIGAERAAALGARYCNFGNGKTRSLPAEGTPQEMAAARAKICETIAALCEINAEYNITVLLEVLSPVVSNLIQSIPEALDLARELGVQNMKPLLDLRWFVDMQHPYEQIIEYADYIKHVHIDNPIEPFPTRYIPRLSDNFDYAPLMEALKKICYKGIISCEANTFADFEQDLQDVLAFFRHFGIEPVRA